MSNTEVWVAWRDGQSEDQQVEFDVPYGSNPYELAAMIFGQDEKDNINVAHADSGYRHFGQT